MDALLTSHVLGERSVTTMAKRHVHPNFVRAIAIATCAIAICALVGCAGGSSGTAASSSSSTSESSSVSTSTTASSSSTSSSSGTSKVALGDVPTAASVIGEDQWGSLLPALGDDAIAFARRVQDELPTAAYAQYSGVASGEAVEFDEPGEIAALFNALASADLGPEAQELRTDDYTSFWFVFADGQRYSFSFDSMAIDLPDDGMYAYYQVEGNDDLDQFAAIALQAYNSRY